MNPTDLDKIVDKLLVFRGRLPRQENFHMSWYQKECINELITQIDDLISLIDVIGEAFE